MNEKPSYYAVLPAQVRYDNDLNDKAKLLYAEISSLANKYGTCWSSDKYFADLYNVSERTIRRLLKGLKDKQYIDINFQYLGETREIDKRFITIRGVDNFDHTCGQFCPRGVDNFDLYNNTSINNKKINIYDFIQSEFRRILSSSEIIIISSWKCDKAMIKLAVQEACLHDAKSIKYVDKIIQNWLKNGVDTVEKAKGAIKKFEETKSLRKVSKIDRKENLSSYYRSLDE